MKSHRALLLPLFVSVVIGATAGRAMAQGDLDVKIAEQSQRIERHNAEIVMLRNSVSGIGDAHRLAAATEIATMQDRIRAAIAKQRQAQQRIDECSNSCDVVVAQRNGLPVTPVALANHNRELADARLALSEAQKEEHTYRIQLGPLQGKVGAVPPAEAEVMEQIVRLTTEVRTQEAALFSLRSQRSQQQLQATIRRSVEELTRPNRPAPTAAVAGSGTFAQVQDAAVQTIEARRVLAELARRAIGEGETSAVQHDLLDALPQRPKPVPAVVPAKPTAVEPAVEPIDVEDLLSRLPARVAVPPPTPAPAVEPARAVGGTSLGLDALRPSAPGDRTQ